MSILEQILKGFLISIWIIIWFFNIFYMIPFLIRKGWNDAENRTKKVCDVCFRDIKKWNKKVEALTNDTK